MQVSIACTEHNLKSRNSEDRLCVRSPNQNVGVGQSSKHRMVSSRPYTAGHAHMKEAIGRHSNMKYSYARGSHNSAVNPPSTPQPSHPTHQPPDVLPMPASAQPRNPLTPQPPGTWVTFGSQISDEMAENLVTIAYENGVNLFDTAEVYASGRAETERGLSRKHIIEGLRGSLSRLQLDYVDIVFANRTDVNAPMEEVVRAMTFVINQGMAMYWGTSRWSAMEIMEAYSVARQFNLIPPVCEQAEYHYFQRDKVEVQLPELYHKIGVGAMTWSPLACGLITGKYSDGIPDGSRAAIKVNSSPVAWCLRSEGVSCVLLGVSNTEQLLENLGAIRALSLMTPQMVYEIDSLLGNRPHSKKEARA
ncbi:hypothetical protein ACEWY4_025158 [Coilia grayii]|uniref:NADP-dependent oxidoreductase domain-containing protein n=1 Tax=Coilia grayii TaxID=363190 RepID=A0ABD1IWZ7_9TELE